MGPGAAVVLLSVVLLPGGSSSVWAVELSLVLVVGTKRVGGSEPAPVLSSAEEREATIRAQNGGQAR